MSKPTREEVDELKRQWTQDPAWEIEETEGFEDYFDELFQFHQEYVQASRDRQAAELQQRAVKLGIADRPELLVYILALERRITELETRLQTLDDTVYEVNVQARSLNKQVQRIDYRTQEP